MAEVESNVKRFVNEDDAKTIMRKVKSYVLSHSGGGGGGGGSTEEPDGDTVINRNSSGDITSMIFTALDGTVTTTTFAETSQSKIIVEHTVAPGASTATVVTYIITGDTIRKRTTTEEV